MTPGRSRTNREKAAARRLQLRAQGLRPIEVWVPDTRAPSFAAEARRQSCLVARAAHAKRDQDFIETIAERGEA